MKTDGITNTGVSRKSSKNSIVYLDKHYPIKDRDDFFKWFIQTPNGKAKDWQGKEMFFDNFDYAKAVLKAIRKTNRINNEYISRVDHVCKNNGIKKDGSSCSLNNLCKYTACLTNSETPKKIEIMNKEAFELKLSEDDVIQSFVAIFGDVRSYDGLRLVGGAVIDIIDNRKPKDYDFLGWNQSIIDKFMDNGYRYVGDTKTAITLIKDAVVVQFLKTDLDRFEFTISQSTYRLFSKTLAIDKTSYDTKILKPTTWNSKTIILDALKRIPHWRKKGFNIKDSTYFSMLNVIKSSDAKATPSDS